MDTPQFLAWALEYACPIRGFLDGRDPGRIERQLRAARAVSDAQREGRVFEGLCVDPPNGFRIDEALAVYGGLAAVQRVCRDCPANVAAGTGRDRLAGCFGILPLLDDRWVHASMESAIEKGGVVSDYERLFLATQPRWYGLWARSPLNGDQLSLLAALFRELDAGESAKTAFEELQQGLQTAMEKKLALHVALYPRGRVEGTRWLLSHHCPRCKADWPTTTSRTCSVCRFVGHPAAPKKRKARGSRPYRPLERLLGERAAAELVVRYEAFRAQPE